jgi:2-iminoacetate synthase ThiH
MLEENVVSQAGGHTAKQPMMTPEDLVFHIRRAGYTAAQRDSSFNILKIFE